MAKSNLLPGFINVNKAVGMTAHDVVNRLRKLSGIKQIGHAGTLDPLACGVLPIAIGRACRLLRFLPDDKVYLASILFGQKTDTDDLAGKVIARSNKIPEKDKIVEALKNFVGDIEQIPPLYSAIHVDGRRLYELARRGETPVEIPKRHVDVYSIELLDYKQDPCGSSRLELRIHCSSGTYIRSIARDLGDVLDSAACLAALERERAGLFKLENSHSLDELAKAAEEGEFEAAVQPPEDLLPQAQIHLTEELAKRLKFGQCITVRTDAVCSTGRAPGGLCKNSESLSKYVLALLFDKLIAVCSIIGTEPNREHECLQAKESSIVELKPEVVLLDGNSF